MQNNSELQRQRVLVRWQKQKAQEASRTVKNPAERQVLLARLIGYLQGDGCVGKYLEGLQEHHNIIFYPDDLNIAHLFVKTFNALYGRAPRITQLENYYRIIVCHKVAYHDLIAHVRFDSLHWNLPYHLFMDELSRLEWLRAIFDCEAYVGPKTIVINSVNEQGLRGVQQLLREFRIGSRWYVYHRKQKNWNTNYILVIARRQDRQTFLNRIGFNHSKKQQKLQLLFAAIA